MGAGRKMQNLTLIEKTQQPVTVNGSVSARNLTKDKLAGVIMGCSDETMDECLSKQIFGLPALHFSYVRNIVPGMPLFLFNYTDRKLHGIYEASSHGQMYIDPYGWTTDGSERTQFPAQVRFCIRIKCQALLEEQYGKILESNYYTAVHFWFELDRMQTTALISLFKPVPISTSVVAFPVPAKVPVTGSKWADLFKPNANSTKRSEDGNSKRSSEADFNLNEFDGEKRSSDASAVHCLDTENRDLVLSGADFTCQNQFLIESRSSDCAHFDEQKHVLEELQDKEAVETEKERVYLKLKQLSLNKISLNSHTNEFVDVDVACKMNGAFLRDECEMNGKCLRDECFPETPIVSEKYEDIFVNSSGLHCVLDQLREEVKELKASSMEQLQKMSMLERSLSDSDMEMQQLKGQVKFLESKLDPSMLSVNGLTGKLVFVMGGYDGVSWLSTLNCYSPSRDITRQLMPMSCARSYASATVLDGRIYNLGGGNGNVRDSSWYDTVECYDCSSDKWSSCHPLSQRKGCLASATICDKIFAVGGGNGVNCFSDVEMFDPILGKWIFRQSMLQKRFCPAAAELNGALYVVGGYDGKNYLSSAERFDPREAYWARLPAMKLSRGSHSLAVLNEKLYALGGHDGNEMVSSVEVFDPRRGSWMQGDEMKQSRANFSAAVIGEAIYVIGGTKEGNAIAETVDIYMEGRGWWVTNLKGIGKRCFFSATVC